LQFFDTQLQFLTEKIMCADNFNVAPKFLKWDKQLFQQKENFSTG